MVESRFNVRAHDQCDTEPLWAKQNDVDAVRSMYFLILGEAVSSPAN